MLVAKGPGSLFQESNNLVTIAPTMLTEEEKVSDILQTTHAPSESKLYSPGIGPEASMSTEM